MPTPPNPDLHPQPPEVVPQHTQALIPAGVSSFRTPFPAPPELSPPAGVGYLPRFPPQGRSPHESPAPQREPFTQSRPGVPVLTLRLRSALQSPSLLRPSPGPFPPPPPSPRRRPRRSNPGGRTSHLQPKMVAPAHVPSSDHRSGPSVPNPPLPPPGSFSTAAPRRPTHSHPHWASPTPITAAPRPTGPFARPSPRKTLATREKLPSRGPLPPPTWKGAHWLPLPAPAAGAPTS